MHLILENEFDTASPTVIDISYLGLFPKALNEVIRSSGLILGKHHGEETQTFFAAFVDDLLAALTD